MCALSMRTTLVRTGSTALHMSFTGTHTLLNEMAMHSGGQAQAEASGAGKGLTVVSLHNKMRGTEVAHKAGGQCSDDMLETYCKYFNT